MVAAGAGVVARGVVDVAVSTLSDVQPISRLPDNAATSTAPRALVRFMVHPAPPREDDATVMLPQGLTLQTAPPGVGVERAQRPCHVGCSRGCTEPQFEDRQDSPERTDPAQLLERLGDVVARV
jgi:hypothetical protein